MTGGTVWRNSMYYSWPSSEEAKQIWIAKAFKRAYVRSKDMHLEFTLELKDILTPDLCMALRTRLYYVPVLRRTCPIRPKLSRENVPALCRIDHGFGYTAANTVTMSCVANLIQGLEILTPEALEELRWHAPRRRHEAEDLELARRAKEASALDDAFNEAEIAALLGEIDEEFGRGG